MATMMRWDPFQDLAQRPGRRWPRPGRCSPGSSCTAAGQRRPRPGRRLTLERGHTPGDGELPVVEAEDLESAWSEGLLTIWRAALHLRVLRAAVPPGRSAPLWQPRGRAPATRSRPTRSRPRSTTACCKSWCPRWRRPSPKASRSAPVRPRAWRQPVATVSALAARCSCGRRRPGDAPSIHSQEARTGVPGMLPSVRPGPRDWPFTLIAIAPAAAARIKTAHQQRGDQPGPSSHPVCLDPLTHPAGWPR